MEAYRHLIEYAIEHGCTVDILAGRRWRKYSSVEDACRAVERTKKCQINLYDDGEREVGKAIVKHVIPLGGHEVWQTDQTEFMEAWDKQYGDMVYEIIHGEPRTRGN